MHLLLILAWLLGSALTAAAQAPEPPLHRLTGTVRDATSSAPLSLAQVTLAGTTQKAFTDQRGRFELSAVPEGTVQLEATRLGFTKSAISLTLTADTDLALTLDPAPLPLSALVVTPGFFGVMSQAMANRQALTREQIETAPQLGEDIFRSVARVPGVSTSDLSAAFGIRGSRPSEVLVMLDGLELYEPFHLKDFDNALSILDVAAIGGVDLMTGGFGAQYGDRLGGVFDVRSMGVAPGTARTQLGLSVTALRAGSRGSFANERGRWLVSARRGYLELALKLTGDDEEHGSPTYYDVFGKVEYQMGSSLLSAHVLHAGDALDYLGFSNDPRISTRYGSSYAWLSWRGPLGRTLSQSTSLATGRLTWTRFTDPGPGRRALPVGVRDERSFDFVALRQEWTQEWSEWTLTRFGAHVRPLSAEYDYDSWRTRDYAEDGMLVKRTDSTRVHIAPGGLALDAWALQRIRLLPSLVVEAGLNWSRREHSGDAIRSPRLNLSFSPHPRTTLRASYGLHAQTHGIHELSALDGETSFAPAERAEQLGLGLEVNPSRRITLRAEAYDRRLSDLRPRWVNPDFPDDMFPEMARTRTRIDPTEGRSRGIELSAARQVSQGWSWATSYVLAQVTERIDGRDVPRQRDQRHTVGLDAAFSPGPKWRFSAAWQYHTGWPRTLSTFTVERLRNRSPFIHWSYEPYNEARLPAYHRLDARVTRHAETRRGSVSFFLDLFNVYDRENPRAIVTYASIGSLGGVSKRERIEKLLPRLPSLGIIWEF